MMKSFEWNARQLSTMVDLHLGFHRARKLMGSARLAAFVEAKDARLERQEQPQATVRARIKGRVLRLP
jgi:hypothetical protein